MYKHLQRFPAFMEWKADRFYQSCGEGFGLRWRGFIQSMVPYGEAEYAALERGALAGFAYFETIWDQA